MKKKIVAVMLSAVMLAMSGTSALAAESPTADSQEASAVEQTAETDADTAEVIGVEDASAESAGESVAASSVDTEDAEAEVAVSSADTSDAVEMEKVDASELADVFGEEAAASDLSVDEIDQADETEEIASLEYSETMPTYEASFSSATSVSAGTTYSGSISSTSTSSIYKITLSTSGKLVIDATAYMERVYINLYESDGTTLYDAWPYWNSVTEQSNTEITKHLTKGVYYLAFSQYSSFTGDYDFSYSFTSAGETYSEVSGGSDNSISTAHSISLGTTYKGQIAVNDDKDYYKLTLSSSGELTLDATAHMERVYYYIYDSNGDQIYENYPYWNSVTEQSVISETLDLKKDTYYLAISKYGSYCGNYEFKFSFVSAGESFTETRTDTNDTMDTAETISLGTTYKGQLAVNDEKDYYKFTLSSADTITVSATAYLQSIYYYVYDSDGNQELEKRATWDSTAGYSLYSSDVELSAGTYYFAVVKNSSYNGNYSFTLKGTKTVTVDPVSSASIGGRAADALRINWSTNTAASGYIIEQYKNSSWTRIARIADNTTSTYRISGLSAATTYQFRIKCFGYSGSTPIYSTYVYVSGKTNPATMSGLKIGGTASNALRLNWTKNSSAEGYIVEQYKSGSWTRIARIEGNSTVTYRISGLSAGTTYKFRVCAFAFDGSTPLYGTYATVSGTTDASSSTTTVSSMSGVKIGGRAADALRVSWTKNSSADGYIVEQYKSGSWTRIARIEGNSTTSYRVSGLSAYTTYQFRVKAFAYSGSSAVYSAYSTISGKTLPTSVSGFKIGGTASDALRVSWTKNSNCDGYIVEMLEDGSWVRVARIASNSTVTYRVEGLDSGTSYVFRIMSFGFDGSTAIYSDYVYTSGSTN